MNRLVIWIPIAVFACSFSVPASAQSTTSRCADCHYAQNNAPAPDHLFDWDRSPHGRNNVGCEKCHGGNSRVFESSLAHAGILNSANKKSPVNRANLPATCGACHVGAFVAFQDSQHYKLLQAGNPDGPTCSTCHDSVAGELLSPKGIEARCKQCHGPDEIAPRAERARKAREMYETLSVVRSEMKLASAMIKKVDDKRRKADLLEQYQQAEVPLTRALNAGHQFVYDDLQNYLGIAQSRVERLMANIANLAQ